MSQDEIAAILDAKNKNDRQGWEQARTISFYNFVAQQGTKYVKSAKDLFKLPWDNDYNEDNKSERRLSKEEFYKLANNLISNGK